MPKTTRLDAISKRQRRYRRRDLFFAGLAVLGLVLATSALTNAVSNATWLH